MTRSRKITEAVICAAALVLTVIALFTGSVKTVLGDDALTVSASFFPGMTVAYSDIDSVELVSGLDIGQRDVGIGSMQLQAGRYENALYGVYRLYSYANCRSYVVIRHGGEVLVLNAGDDSATQLLYASIKAKTAA